MMKSIEKIITREDMGDPAKPLICSQVEESMGQK